MMYINIARVNIGNHLKLIVNVYEIVKMIHISVYLNQFY
jgi:hypothetical protein